MDGQRVLVTGATGQVGRAIAEQLAPNNEVWAAARFSDPQAKADLEALGLKTSTFTLGDQDLSHMPDVDYVIHCAANTGPRTVAKALAANSEGCGFLVQRYRDVTGFFHMSSSSVYRMDQGETHEYAEDDTLGGHSSYSPHYAMSKLSAEAVVRFQSRNLGVPVIMARLNVAYGTHGHGGLPNFAYDCMAGGSPFPRVPGSESHCSPIFEDDIVLQVQGLLEHAEVGAPVVNLGGDEAVTLDAMIAHMESLTGMTMEFVDTDQSAFETQLLDATRRRELAGPCTVSWQEGVRRCLVAKGAITD